MSRWWIGALGLLLLAGAQARQPAELAEPQPAPALELRQLDGQPFDLAELRGQVVMLNFWATWCPPCRREMPSMRRLQERLAGEPFRIIAVNVGESPEEVENFLQHTPLNFTILMDPQFRSTDDWGVPGLPYSFLIDASGRLRYRLAGDYEWDSPEALAIVRGLLANP